jgi:hypothetical protein
MARFSISGSVSTTPTPNRTGFLSEVVTVVAAGTPVSPTAAIVPDGFPITVRADVGNAAKKIYVADSALNVANAAKRVVLEKGDAIELFLADPALIFIDASANGAKVMVMYET